MNQEKEQVRFRGRNNVGISKFRRVDAFLISAALGVTFLSSFGCRSIFFPPEYRTNRCIGDGCYLDGEDATADWNRAKSFKERKEFGTFDSGEPSSGKNVKTSVRGVAPYDSSVTRGSLSEEEEYLGAESNTSWFDKFKAPFHFPKFSFPSFSKSESHPEELSQRRYDDLDSEDTRSRTIETTSSGTFQQERKNTNFFTKLFHSREESNNEDELLGGRNSRPVEAINSERNSSPRSIVNFSNPFSRKDRGTPARKTANKRSLEIENYDQSRFLPPMRMIERYYSLGSIPPVRTETAYVESHAYGDSTFRPKTASAQRVEKTAATPIRDSYRSSYYTPVQNEINVEDGSAEIPASPAQVHDGYYEKRSGAASLSPIPASKTTNSPNVGSGVKTSEARSNNRGITRSIASVIPNQGGVSTVSFPSQGNEVRNDEKVLEADSLYGLQEDEYQVVEAVELPSSNVSPQETSSASPTTPTVPSDVDETFRNSLGSRRSFSWFNSDSDENDATPDAVDDSMNTAIPAPSSVVPPRDEASPSVETHYESTSAPVEELPVPGEAPLDAPEPLAAKALDDIVDSAANQDEPLLSRNLQNNDDVVNSPKLSGQTIATDLANAIMESVEPEESECSFREEPSVLTNLIEEKATQLSESAPTPESVEARKGERLSAPITEEEIAWIDQIKNAIQSLLAEREECKKRGDDVRICDARLRLLYLVIGEYERSIQEIEDENDPLRIFWEKECRGLETLLENQLEEIDPAFVADRLRSGLDSLSAFCQLQIRKILLVESPACYGLFKAREDAYLPGETVFAYSELEYVTSRETEEGFAIDVECRWRLLNADGSPRTSFESQRCSNLSETKLRDIVLNVSIPLPETLPAGYYQLEIQTSDLNAEKAWTCVKRLEVQVVEEEAWTQESTFLGESF
ncbi:MAG: hypothetical protein ACI4NP_06340 [Thermoguttaceae bacterium]